MRALGRAATNLRRGEFGVPQWDQGQRDEPTVRLVGAPFVDHPVVVCLHARKAQVAVAALVERLPAEPGKRREAQGGLGVVGVHVGQSGRPVVTAWPHVLVGHGLPVPPEIVLVLTRCREAWKDFHFDVSEHPDVGPQPVFGLPPAAAGVRPEASLEPHQTGAVRPESLG